MARLLDLKVYDDNEIHYVEDLVPEGWTTIETYTPSPCPWDYYGQSWANEQKRVLNGICCAEVAVIRKTKLNPQGTGPHGRVRFGDNMMPSTYKLIVKDKDIDKAKMALEAHKQAVRAWLNGKGKMPEPCRR